MGVCYTVDRLSFCMSASAFSFRLRPELHRAALSTARGMGVPLLIFRVQGNYAEILLADVGPHKSVYRR